MADRWRRILGRRPISRLRLDHGALCRGCGCHRRMLTIARLIFCHTHNAHTAQAASQCRDGGARRVACAPRLANAQRTHMQLTTRQPRQRSADTQPCVGGLVLRWRERKARTLVDRWRRILGRRPISRLRLDHGALCRGCGCHRRMLTIARLIFCHTHNAHTAQAASQCRDGGARRVACAPRLANAQRTHMQLTTRQPRQRSADTQPCVGGLALRW